jgi:diketogulonate reductase-like aldo/keto reductase
LIHSPWYVTAEDGTIDAATLHASWDAMIKIKEQGLAKSIGVSNFLPAHLEIVLQSKVVPAVNQTEWHAYLQRPALVDLQKRHNIALAAYGSLVPIRKGAPGPLDPVLAALARKYAVSESEVLIRFGLDQDVTAVTTSSKESRLSDYLRSVIFKFTPEEVKEIQETGAKKNFRAFHLKRFGDDDWT